MGVLVSIHACIRMYIIMLINRTGTSVLFPKHVCEQKDYFILFLRQLSATETMSIILEKADEVGVRQMGTTLLLTSGWYDVVHNTCCRQMCTCMHTCILMQTYTYMCRQIKLL